MSHRNNDSHAVACEYALTVSAKFRPVLLKACLHRAIISQLMSAEMSGVSPAGRLLPRRTHVSLREG
jgi:hypothetical protein